MGLEGTYLNIIKAIYDYQRLIIILLPTAIRLIRKNEEKLSLFADGIMLHIENPKDPTKNYYN